MSNKDATDPETRIHSNGNNIPLLLTTGDGFVAVVEKILVNHDLLLKGAVYDYVYQLRKNIQEEIVYIAHFDDVKDNQHSARTAPSTQSHTHAQLPPFQRPLPQNAWRANPSWSLHPDLVGLHFETSSSAERREINQAAPVTDRLHTHTTSYPQPNNLLNNFEQNQAPFSLSTHSPLTRSQSQTIGSSNSNSMPIHERVISTPSLFGSPTLLARRSLPDSQNRPSTSLPSLRVTTSLLTQPLLVPTRAFNTVAHDSNVNTPFPAASLTPLTPTYGGHTPFTPFDSLHSVTPSLPNGITLEAATTYQDDLKFFKIGQPDSAITVLAIAVVDDYKVSEWSSKNLDQLIHGGNQLYEQSLLGRSSSASVSLSSVRTKFIFNTQYHYIRVEVPDSVYSGQLSVYNVRNVIESFFGHYTHCKAGAFHDVNLQTYMAIFREGSTYYMFDSRKRNLVDKRFSHIRGDSAVLIGFKDLEEMATVIVRNITHEDEIHDLVAFKRHSYSGASVGFQIFHVTRQYIPIITKNAYKNIGPPLNDGNFGKHVKG